MTTPDPRIRAAIATAVAALGIHVAPGWYDVAVALVWLAGGLADYVWSRDADRDGRPDGPAWLARQLGTTEADAADLVREVRRLGGPQVLRLLRSVIGASALVLLTGCAGTQAPDVAWKVLTAACRLVDSVPHER